jgi:hypothetical protein
VYRTDREPPERLVGCRLDGPRDGAATLHVKLPEDIAIRTELPLLVEVGDDTKVDPFANRLFLTMQAAGGGGGGGGSLGNGANRGQGNRGGNTNLALPNIEKVHSAEWRKDFHTFNENDALWVVRTSGEDDGDVLDFYVNVDNKCLKNEQKKAGTKDDPGLIESRFVYANVLVGMAMLNGEPREPRGTDEENGGDDSGNIEKRINGVTTALAPVLLPMVHVLATLSIEDVVAET